MIRDNHKITDLELLRVIYDYISAFGWPPSVQDIIDKTPLTSKSSVFNRLTQLEDFGFIVRLHGQARALRLTNRGRLVAMEGSDDKAHV